MEELQEDGDEVGEDLEGADLWDVAGSEAEDHAVGIVAMKVESLMTNQEKGHEEEAMAWQEVRITDHDAEAATAMVLQEEKGSLHDEEAAMARRGGKNSRSQEKKAMALQEQGGAHEDVEEADFVAEE